MEAIQNLNLITAGQFVLIAVICSGVTQAVKQTKLPNGIMPFVAAACGALIGFSAVVATGGGNLAAGAMVGLAAGLTASGVYSGVKGTAIAVNDAQTAKTSAEQAAAKQQQQDIQKQIKAAVDDALAKSKSNEQTNDVPVEPKEE